MLKIHCFVYLLFIGLNGFAQADLEICLEKIQTSLTPDNCFSPRIIIGSQESPAQFVLEITFDIFYDSLVHTNVYAFHSTWFNPDGRVSIKIVDYPSENRRRVTLSRLDGIPKSGHGKIYEDGGVGIIDVIEVRRNILQIASSYSEIPPFSFQHMETYFFRTYQTCSNATVHDMEGKKVWQQTDLLPGQHNISTSQLKSGLYFLVLEFSNGTQVEKILIQHK